MKKIQKKAGALLSILAGMVLAFISSCCHKVDKDPVSCVYGPPPEEKVDKQQRPVVTPGHVGQQRPRPRPVVYGPPPTHRVVKKDSTKTDR